MAKQFVGVCCVYDEDRWLPLMVEGCYQAVDALVFLVGSQPWIGAPGNNAHTLDAIRSHSDPDKKISVVQGDWSDETSQRNAGLTICAELHADYCFVVDADEVYDPAVLRLMMETAKSKPTIDAWGASFTTYWKSHLYVIDWPLTPSGFLPVIFAKIGYARFVRNRLVDATRRGRIPVEVGVCHHLAYATTDDEVIKKTARSRSNLVTPFRPDWFDSVWRRWDEDHSLTNLHPRVPEAYPRTVPQDPRKYPPALRKLYESEIVMRTA